VDYFTLFELPIALPVDKTLLKARHQQLQRQYHPDQYANAPASQQREAVSQSALINEAWQTLSEPLSSLIYFLSLQGITQNEQVTVRDTTFLMQQLMLREQLEEIVHQPDLNQREEKLQHYAQHVQREHDKIWQLVRQHIELQAWQETAELVTKLQFLSKLQQQVEHELATVEEQLFLR